MTSTTMSEWNYHFEVIPETLTEPFTKIFTNYEEGLVRSQPGGFVFTPLFGRNAEKIYSLKPRKDDVWLLSFPKCGAERDLHTNELMHTGTNWIAELLWLLKNDLNFDSASKQGLLSRVQFLEKDYISTASKNNLKDFMNDVEQLPSPRVIRSHIPLYLLPPGTLDTSKVVYIARNPKDTIVSYYFHHKLMTTLGFCGTMEEFVKYFLEDKVMQAPFFPHILEAWAKRHHPNMHFMFYEDMKKDLRGEIQKVAAFLDVQLNEEQLEKLKEHLRFENFQNSGALNYEGARKRGLFNEQGRFMRNGKTGDWKNHFNSELNSKIDEWIEKNLAGSDLEFVTELEHQD